jgi:hypothetical protein
MTTARAIANVACALLPLVYAAAPSTTGTPPGAATPEAVWEKAKDAYRRGGFRAYIESVSPESHGECICDVTYLVGMALGAGMLGSNQETKEMNEILRRYGVAEIRPGVPPDADGQEKPGLRGRKAIHLIQDKVGLYAEMMTYPRRHKVGPGLRADLSVHLGDVRVDGAKATASRGPPFGAITFDKIGNSWFLHPDPECLDDIFRTEKAP